MIKVLLISVLFNILAVQGKRLLAHFSVPSSTTAVSKPVGLYWNEDLSISGLATEKPWLGNGDAEHLISVLLPGAEASESLNPGSTFTLRSADFSSRVRVTFDLNAEEENNEEGTLPYTIKIVNLAMTDRAGAHPLELKHGDGGYIWIEPSEFVLHMTDVEHTFELNDPNHVPFVSVKIIGVDEDREL